MKLTFRPIDTLFFKDGKPFYMGEETWADGLNLPNPSVVHGALKSAYYSENLVDFNKVIQEKYDVAFEKIKILDIFYIIKQQPSAYYPSPLDLVYEKNKKYTLKRKENRTKIYELIKLKGFSQAISNSNQLNIALSKVEVENLEGCLLSSFTLTEYLLDSPNEIYKCRKIQDHFTSEPKIGIARNNASLTTEEGRLYRVDMKRANEFKIGVEIENELTLSRYPKLGGEGKITNLNEELDISQIDIEFNFQEFNTKKFKIYLSTPAIFVNGWLPKWIDSKTFIGEFGGNKFRLTSAFVGKPVMIGGFDMTKNMPKVMRKAVPQGSVYYFELIEGSLESVYNSFNKKSISEFNTAQQGFGITYFGVWS